MRGALEFEYRRLVGKRVRAERTWHDLSQDELAAKAGVTRNFVSAIERGAQGLDAYRLQQIADALGLAFADLMATDERRPH
jgi:transcriptional regulator with XRE-family HTH domain